MDVKRSITSELASIVKAAVREDRTDNSETLSSDVLNSVCSIIEAVFIHGLKESRGASSKTKNSSRRKKSAYPEPNFWPFLEKFTHRNIRAQIGNLNQIKTDIGRARVWIRICLNDRVLDNYLNAIVRDQQVVRYFYTQSSFLRDSDQCDLLLNYTRALGKLTFKAPLNSSILNEWTPTPLKLAGVLTQKRVVSRNASTMLDMEDVMETDENSDVAVAVSALEYDGLDDPALSDISDIRSESQFSVQSRPVAAYGDRRMLFSPTGDSFSGSDMMQESAGSFGGIGKGRVGGELTDIYEGADAEREKLDAILSTLTRSNNEENEFMDKNDKNPFVDSGVVGSPTPAPTLGHGQVNGTEQLVDNEENNQDQEKKSQVKSGEEKEANDDTKILKDTSPSATTDPKPIVDDENLEMSFSPGNSLAGRCWSSPDYDPVLRVGSPSTSSMKSNERENVGSVGTSGFAALFTSLVKNGSVPRRVENEENANQPAVTQRENAVENGSQRDSKKGSPAENGVVPLDENCEKDKIGDATGNEDSAVVANRMESGRRSSSSSLDNFVVIEESQESLDQAAAQKSFRLSLLTKIADDVGLDVQGFKCHSCQRTIGLPLFGPTRFCAYDGHYYCGECHLNEEKVIPARILLNWDFKPRPVSRASKAFMDHIADQPLIDLAKTNPSLCDVVKALNEVKKLRLQLSYVAIYLLSCKESVADDLIKRVWPKEYLYSAVDNYSITDLLEVFNGQMQKHLKSVIHYATKHVLQQCRVCVQKGFICELCNDPKIIYAFQLDSTYRCSKCHAVYHAKCFNNQKSTTCPKCVRRELYSQQAERSSLNLENVLPLAV